MQTPSRPSAATTSTLHLSSVRQRCLPGSAKLTHSCEQAHRVADYCLIYAGDGIQPTTGAPDCCCRLRCRGCHAGRTRPGADLQAAGAVALLTHTARKPSPPTSSSPRRPRFFASRSRRAANRARSAAMCSSIRAGSVSSSWSHRCP